MHARFQTDDHPLQRKHDAALRGIEGNTQPVVGFDRPVLLEGDIYPGIWLESGPLNGAVAALVDPALAIVNHEVFFTLQCEDGYIPYSMKVPTFDPGAAEPNVARQPIGASQIQMVVPIAATAWEVAQEQRDEAFLDRAYRACARWDYWLARYRDTRGTGLCELFCEFDTGHDHSPRTRGLPKRCADNDARQCPASDALPWLAPDLSASVYGGRVALAQMAAALGRDDEANAWRDKAERTRAAIFAHCFDADDGCFYDRDADGRWVRVRGDVLTRVLGEHVVDPPLFEQIYERHIHRPEAFWTAYPLPSIALDDRGFSEELLKTNAWAGGSQALTAIRATRWFDHYGKSGDFAHMMRQWLGAMTAAEAFPQQLDPRTGEMYEGSRYSPAMCVMLAYVARLHGVRFVEDEIEWNCAATAGGHAHRYHERDAGASAELHHPGASQAATLTLNGRIIARVHGDCRVVTDRRGTVQRIISLAPETRTIRLEPATGETCSFELPANATVPVPFGAGA